MLDDYPNVDGVIPLVHGTGCGMASKGEGYEVLKRTQWGYATNPNMGGVLMVGLGCEGFQIGRMKEVYGIVESDTLPDHDHPGDGRHAEDRSRRASKRSGTCCRSPTMSKRETVPASELVLALQCGGSDGYSGITANPALGAAADLLVQHGGTAILSETPEIYGAEHLLTPRAVSREVGEKLVARIEWWEDYTARNSDAR